MAPAAYASIRRLALAAQRCSPGHVELRDGEWVPRGDPMEAALDVFARRVTAGDRTTDDSVRLKFPFDAHRRRMSVVVDGRILVKGAPEAVLSLCASDSAASEQFRRMTARGLRVLAVACRVIDYGTDMPVSAEEAECGLTLLGLVGLEDPPRPAVAEVLHTCRRAGIRVAMVTGDNPDTAAALAREIGLAAEISPYVAAQLPADLDDLGEFLDRDGLVIARVDPETKLRIARALQRRGHVVAMTGDGVNDAPALQEAAIGVAMGKGGTDVARAAADLVLLDDNFETIVTAIEEGRSTFINIRRFLTYHLSDNVAELAPFVVWALTAGHFPLAIGVLQVLALDIGTDVFPALALGAEPPDRRTLDGPPVRGHLLDRSVMARAFAVLGPVEALVALLAFTVSFAVAGWRMGDPFPSGPTLWAASGAAFSAIVFGQVANAFACRSETDPVWRLAAGRNTLLISAVAAEIALLGLLLYVEPVAQVLSHAAPPTAGYIVAASAIPAVLLADACHKRIRARQRR
ncbi:HAD-IC family P-type ATPase [Mycobacterium sp. NPDC003323]